MPSRQSLALVFSVLLWTVTLATAEDEGMPPQRSDQPAIQERGSETSAPTAQREERLSEVVVVAPPAPPPAASSEEVRPRDYELRPHATTLEILNDLPGVVVAQHQGGGKAPQYFVRGFDADHGTDLAVSIDDLPINLRSHAHGQGYADLNPLIPEVVDTIQLRKGPYYAEYGDFATAGVLNVVTKDQFKENFFLAEGGSFDVMRYVGGASHDFHGLKALVAGQAYFADGPFEHPQDFSRYNLFSKLSLAPSSTSKGWLSTSIYNGDWHGSGQIPLREVSAGRLARFGSIDPTEGGHSDREDATLHYEYTPTAQDTFDYLAYGTRYKLQLFSDFTFFKDTGLRFDESPDGRIFDTQTDRFVGFDDRPTDHAGVVPGDGIEQDDQRYLYGGRARYTRTWSLLAFPGQTRVAVENRNDDVDLALHRQVRRNRFFTINQLAISERSLGTYFTNEVFFADRIRLEAGLRGDVFFVDGRNRLPRQRRSCAVDRNGNVIRTGHCEPNFDAVPIAGSTADSIVSPKASLVVTPVENTDLYLDFGEGYHSNDARDALTSFKAGQSSLLTKAIGYELGARTRQFDRLDLSSALWLLDLDSELVFSGDAGNQKTGSNGGNLIPAPATRRWGIDFESRYRVTRWLFADYDLSYADPRFNETSKDGSIKKGDAVPLAPTLLINGGLTAQFANGFSVALRSRFLDDRPAIEDRSLTARGYFLLDLLAKYRWRNLEASLALLNLTNTDWREAQFADNTCVRRELRATGPCAFEPGKQGTHTDPPAAIHFTPGEPIGVRAGLTMFFF